MAKSKKSKNKSDKLNAKRSKPVEKKLNPFELHINKEKHAILNKQLKNNRGFVGSFKILNIKFFFNFKTFSPENLVTKRSRHVKIQLDKSMLANSNVMFSSIDARSKCPGDNTNEPRCTI